MQAGLPHLTCRGRNRTSGRSAIGPPSRAWAKIISRLSPCSSRSLTASIRSRSSDTRLRDLERSEQGGDASPICQAPAKRRGQFVGTLSAHRVPLARLGCNSQIFEPYLGRRIVKGHERCPRSSTSNTVGHGDNDISREPLDQGSNRRLSAFRFPLSAIRLPLSAAAWRPTWWHGDSSNRANALLRANRA